jgi:hypothetical protein
MFKISVSRHVSIIALMNDGLKSCFVITDAELVETGGEVH